MSADSHISYRPFAVLMCSSPIRQSIFPAKSKELLALLVSKRGCSVPLSEIAYTLYSDTPERTAKNKYQGHWVQAAPDFKGVWM